MRYSIRQLNDTTWELVCDGAVIATFKDGPGHDGYHAASAHLSSLLTRQLAPFAGTETGLLAERWASPNGIAFSTALPSGRDFTECQWSWRDPSAVLSPLYLMTEQSMGGHLGAELAGFVEEYHLDGTTPFASGRFYDNEAGRQFRDMLASGPPIGVSVDPTEKVDVEYTMTCTEYDESGMCVAGDETYTFHAYEIGGLTGAPIAAFEGASIALQITPGEGIVMAPMRATLSVPAAPPREWLTLLEPVPGRAFLDCVGDDVLVEQRDDNGDPVGLACPLTIRDDGLVYGHLTYWGQCHIGDPWGPGVCASATPSKNGYADFLTGTVTCDDGTQIPAGVLTVGCEHSSAFDCAGVRDHLAHSGMGWASVNITDGVYGPWLRGALHPGLTDLQVSLLRRLSLSGEWVGELAGVLAVNNGGLPVQRLAASAFAGKPIPRPVRASRMKEGKTVRLVGGNIVSACPECQQRSRLVGDAFRPTDFAAIQRTLALIEQRTRHLIPVEAARLASSLRGD